MNWIAELSTDQKIKAAEDKIEAVIDNVMAIIQVNAANNIINHSDKLSSQVPYSYAGNAYRVFADEMMRGEVLRLCTLWDNAAKERNSMPSIAKLLDDDDVRRELWNRAINRRGPRLANLTEHEDPGFRAWGQRLREEEITEDTYCKFCEPLNKSIECVQSAKDSRPINTMTVFRNFHLAHSLGKRAKKSPPKSSAKVGDAKKILSITLGPLKAFDSCVRGNSFDWDGSFEIAESNAQALWHGVTIDVLE